MMRGIEERCRSSAPCRFRATNRRRGPIPLPRGHAGHPLQGRTASQPFGKLDDRDLAGVADHGINARMALDKLVAGKRGKGAAAGQVTGVAPAAKVAGECEGVDGHVAVRDGEAHEDRIFLEYKVSSPWEVDRAVDSRFSH